METDRGRHLQLTSGFYMCAPHILAHTCKLQGYEAEDPYELDLQKSRAVGRQQERHEDKGPAEDGQGTGREELHGSIPLRPQLGYTMTHSRQIYNSWTHL